MEDQSEKIIIHPASNAPSREVIIGIALVAPILLGILLRFYLLPNTEQANQNSVGNNALMLVGGEGNTQNMNITAQPNGANISTSSQGSDTLLLNDSQIQIPQQLLGQ